MKKDYRLCVKCKSARRLCGLPYCPLIESFRRRVMVSTRISSEYVDGSTPPSLIVGEKNYPRIRIYYSIPPGIHGVEAKIYDDPSNWFLKKTLWEIIGLRSSLLSIVLSVDAYNPYSLYEKEIGLAVLSRKPVDTEAELIEKPIPVLSFDSITPPRGPSARAKRVLVASNPSLHPILEKTIWDDMRASEAVWRLYRGGVDFYTIVRALTIGFLGVSGRRRLVPTRWGITAVDSILGDKLLSTVRTRPSVNNTLVYYVEYLYNKYVVVLAPGKYRGLWIEVWRPHSLWNPGSSPSVLVVRETHSGRMDIMDGGYYAARTSILQYLHGIGRQARVAILREVEPQYMFPVGNWQIRESIAYALSRGPVLKNPGAGELKSFIKGRMSVPNSVLELLIQYVYGFREVSLDKWFKT